MRRYYILEGDKTTVNGVVQKHTGVASTTSWHGRTVSNIDDKILCPACKSVGVIKPVGERHSFGNKGFIPALNDDLCICKCSPPPNLVHSQTVFYQDIGIALDTLSPINNLTDGFRNDKTPNSIKLRFINELTGDVLSNFPHTVILECGKKIELQSDKNGEIDWIETGFEPQHISVEIPDLSKPLEPWE